MKLKDARFRIYIFYLLILAPAVIWAILFAAGVSEKLDTDTGEKRNKHSIEEGTTLANLTEELELTYNDRVPFRSVLLRMNSALDYALETPYREAILPGLTALANAAIRKDAPELTADAGTKETPLPRVTNTPEEKPADETQDAVTENVTSDDLTPYYETPSDEGYYPYVELAPEVIQGRDGWLFRDEEIPDFEGDTLVSDETLVSETENMNTLDALCRERGIGLYFIALPNKSTAYPEYMPSIEKADYTGLQQLEDFVHSSGSPVSFSFLDQEILAAKKYGRLYFTTDTHWNGLGAMACNVYLHNLLGLEPVDMGALPVIEGDPVVGDLVYYTGLPTDAFPTDINADYQYKPDIAVTQIRGGDDIVDEFTSTAPDARTLVFVGDSYRHHILQYLNRDFAHTYFINEKYMTAEHADILKSADILIVENVERNFYVNPDAGIAVSDLIEIYSS